MEQDVGVWDENLAWQDRGVQLGIGLDIAGPDVLAEIVLAVNLEHLPGGGRGGRTRGAHRREAGRRFS